MEILLEVAYGFIKSANMITNFMITPIEINIIGWHVTTFTPLSLMTISGLIFLFTYYLIRGLTI